MAVRSEDLTLVATVRAEASDLATSPADSVIERMIGAASDVIRQYIGRPLHYATLTESYPGRGTTALLLERTPLVSITSIALDGFAFETDGTDYEIADANAGIVYRRQGWPFTGNPLPGLLQTDPFTGSEQRLLSVVYVGGWVTPQQAAAAVGTRSLPYDLEQAAIETVISLIRNRGADRRVVSEALGAASVSYGVGFGGVIPDAVIPVLDSYRSLR